MRTTDKPLNVHLPNLLLHNYSASIDTSEKTSLVAQLSMTDKLVTFALVMFLTSGQLGWLIETAASTYLSTYM